MTTIKQQIVACAITVLSYAVSAVVARAVMCAVNVAMVGYPPDEGAMALYSRAVLYFSLCALPLLCLSAVRLGRAPWAAAAVLGLSSPLIAFLL